MHQFDLIRREDETGISGTGRVCEGVQFSSGRVVMARLTGTNSITIFDSIEDVEKIHGHDGKTVVRWIP